MYAHHGQRNNQRVERARRLITHFLAIVCIDDLGLTEQLARVAADDRYVVHCPAHLLGDWHTGDGIVSASTRRARESSRYRYRAQAR